MNEPYKVCEIIYKLSARGLTKPMNYFNLLKVHLTVPVARQHQKPLKVHIEIQLPDMFLDVGNCNSQTHETLKNTGRTAPVTKSAIVFFFVFIFIYTYICVCVSVSSFMCFGGYIFFYNLFLSFHIRLHRKECNRIG